MNDMSRISVPNMELWTSVEQIDPAHTTKITGKPYSGNSPKPYWIVRRATEIFGPCGIGWGFEILYERIEDGAPGDKLHIAKVRVWYDHNKKRGTVEHVGQTMFCGTRKDGKPYTDEDAPKKSVTDALVKALSMIGFAGDIFIGRFDDSKYVEAVTAQYGQQRSQEAGRQYMQAALKAIEGFQSPEQCKAWWKRDEKNRLDAGIKPGLPPYDELVAACSTKVQSFEAPPADASLQKSLEKRAQARRAPSATQQTPAKPATPPATLPYDPEAIRKRFGEALKACKTDDDINDAWMQIVDPVQDEMMPPDREDLERMIRLRQGELDGSEGSGP